MSRRRASVIITIVLAIPAIACTSTPDATPQTTAQEEPTVVARPTPEPAATPQPVARANTKRDLTGLSDVPSALMLGWDNTDFRKHSVSFFDIISGGVGRDGIPPIDSPTFLAVSENPVYMNDNDPVIALEISGKAKAYPLDILQGHEIVNDELGGVPVTVTYCPLCNTAIVFDRTVDGRVFDFGVSGNLRNSDLIMWDRQTESWWQQITGESIVGEMTGAKLDIIPAPVISWTDFREAFPAGLLLSRDSGNPRDYDNAPYDGYDNPRNPAPFLFLNADEKEGIRGGEDRDEVISRKIDPRLLPMERVVSLSIGGQAVAYPFALLQEIPVVNDSISGQDIVVFYAGGTLSAFEGFGGESNRVVGSTGVYDPVVNGEKLTFKVENGEVVDESTGSRWSILGRATEGPLTGTALTPLVHANHFWFAWAAFNPETEIREVSDFGE